MQPITLFVAAALFATEATPLRTSSPPDGGPPRILVAGKHQGGIDRAQWSATAQVKLSGCVPDAFVERLTLSVGGEGERRRMLSAQGPQFSQAMKELVAGLPSGTTFTVHAVVRDGSGKEWKVPEASFVWMG